MIDSGKVTKICDLDHSPWGPEGRGLWYKNVPSEDQPTKRQTREDIGPSELGKKVNSR